MKFERLNARARVAWRRRWACMLVLLPAAAHAVSFTDAAESAGVLYIQQEFDESDDCLYPFIRYCLTTDLSGGAAVGDYDGDGKDDLLVTRLTGPPILFRNKGDGTFEDVTAQTGLQNFHNASNGAGWADVDNDGDLDLYLTTFQTKRFFLFINDGTGSFVEEGLPRGAAAESEACHWGQSIAFGDYNRDGWVDIHVTDFAQVEPGIPPSSRLLKNRGAEAPGYFEDATVAAGVVPLSALYQQRVTIYTLNFANAFVDLDRDGWLDLAIVSDVSTSRLYMNNGDGTFSDVTVAAAVGTEVAGMGSAFGDYDGDGDLDWFVTAISCEGQCTTAMRLAAGNRLYRNNGDGLFTDATDAAGVRRGYYGWGACFFDHDNDGDLDLTMTNGALHPKSNSLSTQLWRTDPMRFWENNGAGVMTERSANVGLTDKRAGQGLLAFDYDGDGDVDIFVVNKFDEPLLYRNDGGNEKDWLRVKVRAADRPFEGLGAWVEVETEEGGPSQVRQVGVSSHYLGQSERILHFGLGEGSEPVHELRVTWPVTGMIETFNNLPRNATFDLVAPAAEAPAPPTLLRVVAPNGGERWAPGSKRTIRWIYGGNAGRRISITLLRNGTPELVIASETSNDSMESWTIPSDLTEDSNYGIRIAVLDNPDLSASSEGTFAIETNGESGPIVDFDTQCTLPFFLIVEQLDGGEAITSATPNTPTEGTYILPLGEAVQMTAIPSEGKVFDYWHGLGFPVGRALENPFTFHMYEDVVIRAFFKPRPVEQFALTTNAPEGGFVDPSGSTFHDKDSIVTLTATPANGWAFERWEGSLTGTSNPAMILMDGPKEISAIFIAARFALSAFAQGPGSVSPVGTTSFTPGSPVTLIATPNAGAVFTGWTGDVVSTANPLNLLMDRNYAITGMFIDSTEGGHDGEWPEPQYSSVDFNQDYRISLNELLRGIQFFNSAGYHCDNGQADGFAPGPGAAGCAYHTSDYNPPDWRIVLSELLRLIQFYNSGAYTACPGAATEDGFCTLG